MTQKNDVQEEVVEREEAEDAVGAELSSLKELVEQLDNKFKRSLADYQNLQRRTQEEKGMWIRSANKDLILKLLPVLDTLLLAGRHLQDKGLELAIDQFEKVLETEGVKKIETIGKKFDPLVMECVETKEGNDWEVLEEVRAGYRSDDLILRPAYVVVGQRKPKVTMNKPPESQEKN